jgi:hypothetical protein
MMNVKLLVSIEDAVIWIAKRWIAGMCSRAGSRKLRPFTYVLLAGILSACASGPPSYEQNIQSAISGGGNVFVKQSDDGVVILNGWVEDTFTKIEVLRAASKGDHVKTVIDYIQVHH